ncbi:MAG TPA: MFS transporter [Zoogloea sp.]|uniref:MFS transporter n=1 Tax=Zoogloea sp. TaxID=49181 RepID=UPI002CE735FB|nr:MFS transporter [Zoogloea sp.]HMV18244.1 MFS transporter [Rhodocyclaceae bacterium]HMV63632.1 MFS transporter [Rhodocyclaceae bacterium]HMW51505.1 MFS transporter [Rhodocyclaceae bacterium]HMY49514.1 MFS transporter [Rhodocyclaceae bacterium]HMZ76795.1 MFS transporter [Rhodocyclaceae bacterium]
MIPYWRLSGYYFFYFAFVGAFSPYFSLYLQSIGRSAAQIALLMSLLSVMRLVAPNLWGWLADRLGARVPIVRLSAVLSLAGFAGFLMTESPVGLFASMAVLAFFWSAALPLVEALTFSHLGAHASRYGSIRVWGSVGFILAVLGLGYVLDGAPIRTLLWITLGLLGGILVYAAVLPEGAAPAHSMNPASLGEVLRRREVRALLTACFFMSAAHGALYVFYSVHLVQLGHHKTLVGWMWTLGVVAEIAVFMAMPQILRRYSLRGILLFSFAVAVVRFLLIGWGANSLAVLILAQIGHGATFGAYHAAGVAAINRWFGPQLQARGQALYGSVSFGAGGMVGGVVSGYTWDSIGAGWTYTLGSAFALMGLAVLLAGWRPAVREA